MRRRLSSWICLAVIYPMAALAGSGFDIVVLGARGGIDDGDQSGYLIRPHDDNRFITCDAGSLIAGIKIAEENGVFDDIEVPSESPYGRVGYILTDRIKGYLISHAHLDHIAGLIIASPSDSKKPIYSLISVSNQIQINYFNWEAWPNFGDRGRTPQLKKYHYQDLRSRERMDIADTRMAVTALPLSHGGIESTAFLIESGEDALLCFGDTGPDEIEMSTRMHDVWAFVADRVKQRRLKGIIIETSYTNAQPDNMLFGHLTPNWLLKELRNLNRQAGGSMALNGLPIIIGHIKYSIVNDEVQLKTIRRELEEQNDIGVRFIFPSQGSRWRF